MVKRIWNAAKLTLRDVRPEEVSSILQSSPAGAAASLLNALVFFAGAYGYTNSWTLSAWLAATIALFTWIGMRSLAARRTTVTRVSRRASRRMTMFSILFAAPWAALPPLFFGVGDATVDVSVLMVSAGMSAGGAFMLHRVPAAAIGYFATILISVIITFCVRDFFGNWPLVLYSCAFCAFLVAMTLSAWRTAREREAHLEMANAALSDLTEANAELERLRAQAEHVALHDPLTELANRRGLERMLAQRLKTAGAAQARLWAFHIDLDRFKEINDTRGHAAGDFVLAHVAKTLRDGAEFEQVEARVGGDEFVILGFTDLDDSALIAYAERLVARLNTQFEYEGEICSVGASIGVARRAIDAFDQHRILADADIALYRAKELGRGRAVLFSTSLREAVERKKALSDELQLGLERGEIAPYFQPQ
ncbi:MAG: diguanylate cyclase, partial [Pseudomonadota bacterium]